MRVTTITVAGTNSWIHSTSIAASGHRRLLAGAVADEGLLPGLATLGAAGGAQGFRGGPGARGARGARGAAIPGRWDRWRRIENCSPNAENG